MNTQHTDQTSDHKTQAAASSLPKQQGMGESSFQPACNESETVQRKWQEAFHQSPQTKQFKVYQEMANNSARVKQLMTYQLMADTFISETAQRKEPLSPIQKKENHTGLPDQLKSGIETISGYAMDDVKVHYNSSQPAQLSALAYAQGRDIHVAPGQEKHLPHEAWHVVQQKQGRVKPSFQMKGQVGINNDAGLEKEADVMGAKALQAKFDQQHACCCPSCNTTAQLQSMPVVQRTRYFSDAQVHTLGESILTTMSNMEENGESGLPEYNRLETAYNSFEEGSASEDTIRGVIAATNGSASAYVQELNTAANQMLQTNATNIRASNYPSAYNAAANNARDNYQAGRLLPGNQWNCPGNGGNRAAHAIADTDITIDHINPCANQWNNTGYNTNRTARNTWYNDPTNHRYMCRGCNSSLGSGGILYRMDTGPNYNQN